MTREEAIEKAAEAVLVTRATIGRHVAGQAHVNVQDVVIALEALGLLKFGDGRIGTDNSDVSNVLANCIVMVPSSGLRLHDQFRIRRQDAETITAALLRQFEIRRKT
jgi:hypothetical protein